MAVVILLAFNGFVLFLVLSLFLGFSHHPSHFEQCIYALISFGVVCGLAVLFNSAAGQWLLRLTSGARNAIGREQARLDPIIAQVEERLNQQLRFSPLPVKLMIVDDPLPNGFAIGKETLILSRTL
jgi:heat shock protein HtpX